MRFLRSLRYWLLSPASLEDLRGTGIGPAYSERLRAAGVNSPKQLYRFTESESELAALATETGIDLNLLKESIQKSRRPWFQNYKLTGLLAVFFGVWSLIGTVISIESFVEARKATKEQKQVLDEFGRSQQILVTPLWSLRVTVEFSGLPESLFSEYFRDISGPQSAAARGNPSKIWGILNKSAKEAFLGHWMSYTSKITGERFDGGLRVLLFGTPPLTFQLDGCDKQKSNHCKPYARVLAPGGSAVSAKEYRVTLGKSVFGNSVSYTEMNIGPNAQPVNLEVYYGPAELEQLGHNLGQLKMGSFPTRPQITYFIPTDHTKTVRSANEIEIIADIPDDVVQSASQVLPTRITLTVIGNDDFRTLRRYSFSLLKQPELLAEAVVFGYELNEVGGRSSLKH